MSIFEPRVPKPSPLVGEPTKYSEGSLVFYYQKMQQREDRGKATFFAKAPTPENAPPGVEVPRSENVVHLFSVVFLRGTRYYAFPCAEHRDAFVAQFPCAEVCEAPL